MGVVKFPDLQVNTNEHEEWLMTEEYPNGLSDGLNEMLLEFYEAAYFVFATDEIDKLIAEADTKDVEELEMLKKYFSGVRTVSDMPHWTRLMEMFSDVPSIYSDIISIMILHHKRVCKDEELKKRISWHIDSEEKIQKGGDHK